MPTIQIQPAPTSSLADLVQELTAADAQEAVAVERFCNIDTKLRSTGGNDRLEAQLERARSVLDIAAERRLSLLQGVLEAPAASVEDVRLKIEAIAVANGCDVPTLIELVETGRQLEPDMLSAILKDVLKLAGQ